MALSHTMKLVREPGQEGLVFWFLGRGSWLIRFSDFLNYIPSYRHARRTASFDQIIGKDVN